MKKATLLFLSLLLSGAAYAQAVTEVINTPPSPRSHKAVLKSMAVRPQKAVSRVSSETVTLPWTENFDSEESLEKFTILDLNDDFTAFEWSDGMAQLFALFAEEANDDWLITPGFRLEANTNYQFSFRASCYDPESPELFNAWLGTAPDAESMTIAVIETTEVAQDNSKDFSATLKVPTAGIYYFGIHCITPVETAFTFNVDDISIKEGPVEKAPAAISDLVITPDAEGELSTTISFKAPELTSAGEHLPSLTKIEIYRDDTNLIKTFDNPIPGTTLEHVDNTPVNGDNHYTIVPYNEVGEGQATMQSLFVGVDVPSVPQNITQRVDGDDVILTWEDLQTGWNGHYVNTSKLTYNIWESTDGITLVEVAKGVTGSTHRFEGRAETGKQAQNIYVVQAESVAGTSSRGFSNTLLLGKSLELPFAESCAEKKFHSTWFRSTTDSNDTAATSDIDQNGDGGSIMLTGHQNGCSVTLFSSKISIKDEPMLQLSFWYQLPEGAQLSAGLSKDFETLKSVELQPSDTWKLAALDFSDLTANNYAQIVFTFKAGPDAKSCNIDNILLTADPLGIETVVTDSEKRVVARYGIDGRPVADGYHGVIIERLADGSSNKVVIR